MGQYQFQVGYVNRGDYSATPATEYKKMHLVTYDGGKYEWIATTGSGITAVPLPTDTTKWKVFIPKPVIPEAGGLITGTKSEIDANTNITVGKMLGSLTDTDQTKRRIFVNLPGGQRRGLAWEEEGATSTSTMASGTTTVFPGTVGINTTFNIKIKDGKSIYQTESIVAYKVYKDNVFIETITATNGNTVYTVTSPNTLQTTVNYSFIPVDSLGNVYARVAANFTTAPASSVGPDVSDVSVSNKPVSISENTSFTTWVVGIKDVGGGVSTLSASATPAGFTFTVTGDRIDVIVPTSVSSSTAFTITITATTASGVATTVTSFITTVLKLSNNNNRISTTFQSIPYVGTGLSQTVFTNIDLVGGDGMILIKSLQESEPYIFDTKRGGNRSLRPSTSLPEETVPQTVTNFGTSSFTLGTSTTVNASGIPYTAYVFKKREKFFDVVLYTGDGQPNRIVTHGLNCSVGMVIFKRLNAVGDFYVYHKNTPIGDNYRFKLNDNNATPTVDNNIWSAAPATNSSFTVGNSDSINKAGEVYVAYFFADDISSDGMIRCDNLNEPNSRKDLNWVPQFLLWRGNTAATTGGGEFSVIDEGRPIQLPIANAIQENKSNNINYINTEVVNYGNPSGAIFLAVREHDDNYTNSTGLLNVLAKPTGTATTVVQYAGRPDYVITIDTGLVYLFQIKSNMAEIKGTSGPLAFPINQNGIFPCETTINPTNGKFILTPNSFSLKSGYFRGLSGNMASTSAVLTRNKTVFDTVHYLHDTMGQRTIKHGLATIPTFVIFIADTLWTPNNVRIETAVFPSLSPNNVYNFLGGPTTTTDMVFSTDNISLPNSSSPAGQNGLGYTERQILLFADKTGVCKTGSYTGNGAVASIDCGFATGARFIALVDATVGVMMFFIRNGTSWLGTDYTQLLNSVGTIFNLDVISDYTAGFTVTQNGTEISVNKHGNNYLYMALA